MNYKEIVNLGTVTNSILNKNKITVHYTDSTKEFEFKHVEVAKEVHKRIQMFKGIA